MISENSKVCLKVELINTPKRLRLSELYLDCTSTPTSKDIDQLGTSNTPKFNVSLQPATEKREYTSWVPDYHVDKCKLCDNEFSAILRKHHCRYCGNIFCAYCACDFLLLPGSFKLNTTQRVCTKCAGLLKPLQEYLIKKSCSTSLFFNETKAVKLDKMDTFSNSEEFNLFLTLEEENSTITDSLIEIRVYKSQAKTDCLGKVQTTLLKLLHAHKQEKILLVESLHSSSLVVQNKEHLPLALHLKVLPLHLPKPSTQLQFKKHIMMITRGTRGDIQPFLSLALGLAELKNFHVTLCTESRYEEYILKHTKDLSQGKVEFKSVGGDTQRTVDGKLGKWAIGLESDLMNTLMLSRSEVQFFDSEPAVYFHAKILKPDYLIFGFTMAAVTMNVSEALNIPLLGFVLQPTCIPTKEFPPIIPLDQSTYTNLSILSTQQRNGNQHKVLAHLKEIFENNPITAHLNTMRASRGLITFSQREEGRYTIVNAIGATGFPIFNKTWKELTIKKVPLILPIDEIYFGPKPSNWSENTIFTECIFLRGKKVPKISQQLNKFIQLNKDNGQKLVVLAFSSMPVSAKKILKIANLLIQKVNPSVSVIAVVGDKNYAKLSQSLHFSPEHNTLAADQTGSTFWDYAPSIPFTGSRNLKSSLLKALQKDINEQRFFILSKTPFNKLFPLVDCVIHHGGLGTTSEVILSGNPSIVTGVLLFDQRFWGLRCQKLGIGPYPVHINRFPSVCVEYVSEAVSPGAKWKRSVVKLQQKVLAKLQTKHEIHDGVRENVEQVENMLPKAKVYRYEKPETLMNKAMNAAIESFQTYTPF
eukprot:maker-scaffold_1-snap-gene-3.1-mRNA-1 protein AED:0.01 eAED:0.01 QI:0/1/0.75/1/1/1/4/29/813